MSVHSSVLRGADTTVPLDTSSGRQEEKERKGKGREGKGREGKKSRPLTSAVMLTSSESSAMMLHSHSSYSPASTHHRSEVHSIDPLHRDRQLDRPTHQTHNPPLKSLTTSSSDLTMVWRYRTCAWLCGYKVCKRGIETPG
jgi:hypothetical protein